MKYEVSRIVGDKSFRIDGLSYAGAPKSNTAMFITQKVKHLLKALLEVDECLVFTEPGMEVDPFLREKHAFHFSENPQLAYAKLANLFYEERQAEEALYPYRLTSQGYYVSGNPVIGENAYIEPGCVIGHDVQIGKNARILAGSVIRHAAIGDDFVANEYAVIGACGFTVTEDKEGNRLRIPTLGRVVIGNHVEIGAHDNVSCGSGGDTVIEDWVKVDALVHIAHDVHLHKNVEITAGGIIGGFDELGEHAYVGINAVLRNRITIGNNAVIGMGATVTKSVEADVTVAGNPARRFAKK